MPCSGVERIFGIEDRLCNRISLNDCGCFRRVRNELDSEGENQYVSTVPSQIAISGKMQFSFHRKQRAFWGVNRSASVVFYTL